MRRSLIILTGLLITTAVAAAQQDRLEGRWQGTVQSPQGERPAAATFKKSGDGYTGTITGRGNQEMPFKQIKVEGDKITAQAEIESPQGAVVVNYEFTVQGDALKGKGEIEFGGQSFTLTYDLKRGGAGQPAATPPAQQTQPAQSEGQQRQQSRPIVPQPQQKPSLDYFIGQWSFKWLGRESPLTPGGSVEGTVTFTKSPDGKFADGRWESKSANGIVREASVIGFDENRKVLASVEQRSNGVQLIGIGDWNSPIIIRFAIKSIEVKGQKLQLNRTISVISAHSFSITEELSEDGGPFVRLGSAVFTKVGARASTQN